MYLSGSIHPKRVSDHQLKLSMLKRQTLWYQFCAELLRLHGDGEVAGIDLPPASDGSVVVLLRLLQFEEFRSIFSKIDDQFEQIEGLLRQWHEVDTDAVKAAVTPAVASLASNIQFLSLPIDRINLLYQSIKDWRQLVLHWMPRYTQKLQAQQTRLQDALGDMQQYVTSTSLYENSNGAVCNPIQSYYQYMKQLETSAAADSLRAALNQLHCLLFGEDLLYELATKQSNDSSTIEQTDDADLDDSSDTAGDNARPSSENGGEASTTTTTTTVTMPLCCDEPLFVYLDCDEEEYADEQHAAADADSSFFGSEEQASPLRSVFDAATAHAETGKDIEDPTRQLDFDSADDDKRRSLKDVLSFVLSILAVPIKQSFSAIQRGIVEFSSPTIDNTLSRVVLLGWIVASGVLTRRELRRLDRVVAQFSSLPSSGRLSPFLRVFKLWTRNYSVLSVLIFLFTKFAFKWVFRQKHVAAASGALLRMRSWWSQSLSSAGAALSRWGQIPALKQRDVNASISMDEAEEDQIDPIQLEVQHLQELARHQETIVRQLNARLDLLHQDMPQAIMAVTMHMEYMIRMRKLLDRLNVKHLLVDCPENTLTPKKPSRSGHGSMDLRRSSPYMRPPHISVPSDNESVLQKLAFAKSKADEYYGALAKRLPLISQSLESLSCQIQVDE